jgi:hypothetical protein
MASGLPKGHLDGIHVEREHVLALEFLTDPEGRAHDLTTSIPRWILSMVAVVAITG